MAEALAIEADINADIDTDQQSGGFLEYFRGSRLAQYAAGFAMSAVFMGASAEAADASNVSTPPAITSARELPPGMTLFFSSSESHSRVSASSVATGAVTILSYIRAQGLPRKYVTPQNCFWSNGGENTGETIYGPSHPTSVNQVAWFYDSRETYVCHVPRSLSPTGFAKAACGNFFIPSTKPPENVHVINGKVIMVRNRANAKVTLNDSISVTAIGHDQFGNVCGEATASAQAHETVKLKQYVKSGEGRGNIAVRLYDRIIGKLGLKASAEVNCGTTEVVITQSGSPSPTPTPSPTPPPPPTVTFVQQPPAFEQPYENTTEQVDVTASAPNNDPVTVSIWTSDGNCASAGPVFKDTGYQEYGSQLAFGGDSCVGEDIKVYAEATDNNTGESSPVEFIDIGQIAAQPNPNG